MEKRKWVTIEWDDAAEAFMVDMYFDTAPPGKEEFHLGLGKIEAQQLYKAIQLAFKRLRQRDKKSPPTSSTESKG